VNGADIVVLQVVDRAALTLFEIALSLPHTEGEYHNLSAEQHARRRHSLERSCGDIVGGLSNTEEY
jgi:hypothetical protein